MLKPNAKTQCYILMLRTWIDASWIDKELNCRSWIDVEPGVVCRGWNNWTWNVHQRHVGLTGIRIDGSFGTLYVQQKVNMQRYVCICICTVDRYWVLYVQAYMLPGVWLCICSFCVVFLSVGSRASQSSVVEKVLRGAGVVWHEWSGYWDWGPNWGLSVLSGRVSGSRSVGRRNHGQFLTTRPQKFQYVQGAV